MTPSKSQQCPTCEGGGMQYMDKVCPDCGGTGRIEATDTPMGVSQWKAHGIKFGYWDFFAKNICPGFTCGCFPVHSSKEEHDAARTTEDMGELDELMEILAVLLGFTPSQLPLSHIDAPGLAEARAAILRWAAAHDRARLDAVLEAIGRDEINDNNYNETWAGMRKGSPQSVRDSFRAELRTAVLAIFKMEDRG